MSTKKITTVGLLCAMAIVANLLVHFPLVPAAGFLSYDPKDIVIVIGGFIYGPMTSFIMSAITSFLEMMYRGDTLIDVLMNVISTCAFVCPAAYFYKKNHTKKGALVGLGTGIILTTLCMLLWNYIITPIYYGMPREDVIAILLPGILPFNLIKSGLNSGITLFLYKPIVTILRSTNLVEKKNEVQSQRTGLLLVGFFLIVTVICILLVIQGII